MLECFVMGLVTRYFTLGANETVARKELKAPNGE